jgi:uncharacterized protein YukE
MVTSRPARRDEKGAAMTRMGADTEQLHALGAKLKAQMEVIDTLTTTVTGALANTTWDGPARQRFEQDWHSSFAQALGNLKEAFDAAGTECQSRAAALAQAMGLG